MTYADVYNAVRRIPSGKVATYGQIAALCGNARAARYVGTALAVCDSADVPCHRVVDASGGTKDVFDVNVRGMQRILLEDEGVEFHLNGRVDLDKCRWDGISSQ